MNWQIIIVFFILTIAVAWAVYMIWNRIKHTEDPCNGCAGCDLKKTKRLYGKYKRNGKCHVDKRKGNKYLRE